MDKKFKYDFSGMATKANVRCSDGRTIAPHSFKDNNNQIVPLVWNHDHNNVNNVIGHALLEDREDGVYAYCSLNDTDKGRNAKIAIDHGDVRALSIYANKLVEDENSRVTHGMIREVSLVLAGANPGAYIDTIIAHSDTSDEEAIIYTDDGAEDEIIHSEEGEKNMEINKDPNKQVDPNENNNQKDPTKENDLSHAAEGNTDKTVGEVYDGMSQDQKTAVAAIVEQAVADALAEKNNNNKPEENKNMKHNAFENENNQNVQNNTNSNEPTPKYVGELSHSEFETLMNDAQRAGSLRAAVRLNADKYSDNAKKEGVIKHGINPVETLFPETHNVTPTPRTVDNDQSWVGAVINGVKNVPFSKIKSTYIDITADEARAKGYVKGNQKVEEVIQAFKRETNPTTIYKLQKMDRDDVIDITDFDVIAYLKAEMRVKLQEELARAILFGDGRDISSKDKINEQCIRPIARDNNVYTLEGKTYTADTTIDQDAEHLVDDVILSMEDYKGSGNLTGFIRHDMYTRLRLLKDSHGYRLYKNAADIADNMDLNRLVSVPTKVMPADLYLIAVDLRDYDVGRNNKGAINFFDDFDLDFNKLEYLIETRCSGALVAPYSAIVFKKEVK